MAKLAVFTDLNSMRLSPEMLKKAITETGYQNEIVFSKFYNFDNKRHRDFAELVNTYGSETALPISNRKKVRPDIRLVIDSVKVCTEQTCDAILLICGELDIMPLLTSLKNMGIEVIMAVTSETEINSHANRIIILERELEEKPKKEKVIKKAVETKIEEELPKPIDVISTLKAVEIKTLDELEEEEKESEKNHDDLFNFAEFKANVLKAEVFENEQHDETESSFDDDLSELSIHEEVEEDIEFYDEYIEKIYDPNLSKPLYATPYTATINADSINALDFVTDDGDIITEKLIEAIESSDLPHNHELKKDENLSKIKSAILSIKKKAN